MKFERQPLTTIGSRLKDERTRLGYSQAELASRVGVTRMTQVRYEATGANFDAGYLQQVARLGIDVRYLLFGTARSDDSEDWDLERLGASVMLVSALVRRHGLTISNEGHGALVLKAYRALAQRASQADAAAVESEIMDGS
ncbi:helix-turn-helix domain-containing protein [Pelomonas sp. KK5]|uniref:helix-turn-helix domain-containing protein n=1 Tax=Pelomonas sp. KK5 TaxID=1855730 RepID=UPI00097BB056|nr:helix-turn-helix transcriptional regulator [Pelomonas sp. KK5]